ncbi:MAG TPA: helix-turn-helix domain-containing protein [Puia sp.]|nr:helix-turn-helix domain-containing protein [Puia sp.]
MRKIKEASTNNQNRKEIIEHCPIYYTLDKIGGRWKPLILWYLREGCKRYSELKKDIPTITEKMLIQHLKQLEADKLITRKVIAVMPPHVEYKLTKSGKEIIPALNSMATWGIKNNGKYSHLNAVD